MYASALKKNDYLAAFAYFKNYFDRLTAHFDFKLDNKHKSNKPNYKAFYHEGAFISFYSSVSNSETIIKTAHRIRNGNPITHSSSDIISSNTTSTDILDSIQGLQCIIAEFIKTQL